MVSSTVAGDQPPLVLLISKNLLFSTFHRVASSHIYCLRLLMQLWLTHWICFISFCFICSTLSTYYNIPSIIDVLIALRPRNVRVLFSRPWNFLIMWLIVPWNIFSVVVLIPISLSRFVVVFRFLSTFMTFASFLCGWGVIATPALFPACNCAPKPRKESSVLPYSLTAA